MKLKPTLLFILFIFLMSCTEKEEILPAKKDQLLITYVNPFIGSGGHGHTYPGATIPFGMMQLSPDTRLEGWDGCSGYHYSDRYIYGFSHTHLSGTGVSDYGDILLMPTNKVNFNNGSDGKDGYRAHFSHANEKAEPGYYKVKLDSTNIEVELTVSQRSGIQKYQFPDSEHQYVVIDLEHRDELLDHKIQKVNDYIIKGYRHSKAWATDQRLFYHMTFSHPIESIVYEDDGKAVSKNYKFQSKKAVLKFKNPKNEAVMAKIGISAVDEEGALKNLEAEIGTQSFEAVRKTAQNAWESQLEKIKIESTDNAVKSVFYTALYHTMIAPNLYQDVDGRYRGMDLNIHSTQDFEYYTVFSLWDTYRAAHPLYTIIEQDRTNDFINTFLAKYDEGGIMPIWDLSANYTGCMIGYHAVPVIADAYLKGIRDYDADKALQAMKHSATRDHLGLESYKSLGFIPVESESESVSKTLEYAYDDWTIAQMAKEMGSTNGYNIYLERAQYYKNVFDPESKFMRGRFRNTWFSPFDPYEVNFNYTEANAWQYSFYVPQDISGFAQLMGGKAALERHLDALFSANDETSGRSQADITGLIGQYAHGNEPSHHMAYLYNFVNKPHKTMEKVDQIMTQLYANTPDGISGNEDCGQMSAWYVFSAMGFYPVTPASNQYIIGKPHLDKATITLENGKQFTVVAHNLSAENIYIDSVTLNGKTHDNSFITHQNIVDGGTLEFFMTNTPSDWAKDDDNIPVTAIREHLIVPVPFIAKGDVAFKGSTTVALASADKDSDIYYRIDNADYSLYKEPISITQPCVLEVYGQRGDKQSTRVQTQFYKIDPNLSITLSTMYANQYNAGGNDALIDGILGTKDFRTGTWQGYWDEDLSATVDLGRLKSISSVDVGFLQDQRSWIFYPTAIECYGSADGANFDSLGTITVDATKPSDDTDIYRANFQLQEKDYRYIKIVAKKLGELPKWHLGYKHDGRSWIFADEITIK
ncbi:MAG: glycoside hydrolase family 92 protein [Winogradskyella sp.]|nr:glycoside hydrolase family 92 protein [Winogradskyella sp.]